MNIYDLALLFTHGIGPRTAAHLIDTFGSAERIFSANEVELRQRASIVNTDIVEAITSCSALRKAEQELNYCEKHHIYAVAATDTIYPALLREIPDRPHVIFVQGSLEALSKTSVAFVGTRNISTYGQVAGRKIIEQLHDLRPEAAIVSGLAFGNDENAHKAALEVGATTVAVIANALPEVQPSSQSPLAKRIIEAQGAIVTEVSSQHKNTGRFFPSRNRIIAGRSNGTVVVESPYEGGSLITAEYALDYERVLMAMPGRIFDKNSFGTNLLIKQNKAAMVCSGSDIAYQLGWETSATEEQTFAPTEQLGETLNVTPDERVLLDAMQVGEVVDYETLFGRTSFTPQRVMALLTGLELCDAVRLLPGRKCERLL